MFSCFSSFIDSASKCPKIALQVKVEFRTTASDAVHFQNASHGEKMGRELKIWHRGSRFHLIGAPHPAA
ncbi:hypothetical protein Scep_013241 [Stephania cephalantha]|uniref:Uncharacterized protein n=1 Tax=Stephania cephalantha TaxID=152367 RepID=A0AAP0JII3_9MAGN